LIHIPEEVWLHAFRFLDISSLGNISITCKVFHKMLDDQYFWKEVYERDWSTKNNGKKLSDVDWKDSYKRINVLGGTWEFKATDITHDSFNISNDGLTVTYKYPPLPFDDLENFLPFVIGKYRFIRTSRYVEIGNSLLEFSADKISSNVQIAVALLLRFTDTTIKEEQSVTLWCTTQGTVSLNMDIICNANFKAGKLYTFKDKDTLAVGAKMTTQKDLHATFYVKSWKVTTIDVCAELLKRGYFVDKQTLRAVPALLIEPPPSVKSQVTAVVTIGKGIIKQREHIRKTVTGILKQRNMNRIKQATQ